MCITLYWSIMDLGSLCCTLYSIVHVVNLNYTSCQFIKLAVYMPQPVADAMYSI